VKQIIHGKAKNTTILYVFASSFKETLFWFGKQLHLINFVWLFEHSQHEKGPKEMAQFKDVIVLYCHLLLIVPNKSFTKDVVIYHPWNTKWLGILPSSLLLFGNLSLLNCKAHIPLFYQVSPPLCQIATFCLIVRVNTTQFLVLFTCIMLTYHSTTASMISVSKD